MLKRLTKTFSSRRLSREGVIGIGIPGGNPCVQVDDHNTLSHNLTTVNPQDRTWVVAVRCTTRTTHILFFNRPRVDCGRHVLMRDRK